ncbi:hypothetical protein WJX77_005362 [Trebouxia sp. C0004]
MSLESVTVSALTCLGLECADAVIIQRALADFEQGTDAAQVWSKITRSILTAKHPFAVHTLLFKAVYSQWSQQEKGPAPVWVPEGQEVANTNLIRFMAGFQGNQQWQQGRSGKAADDWRLLYKVSCTDPEVFWPSVLQCLKIPFDTKPTRMLQTADDPDEIRWLPGARFNIAAAALCTRHAASPAIVWADESSPSQLARVSLGRLKQRCQQVAAALAAAGFRPGDAIAINMPMTVEAVVIYLGVIYAGCAAVSIADSFAPSEISTRLQIAHTKAIFVQDVILRGGKAHPLYQRVIKAQGPLAIVLPAPPGKALQVQLREGDMSYADFLSKDNAQEQVAPHVADAYDTCNILFSSGTTGQPKAIPWTHTTPIRSAANAFFHQDVREGDTVAWPTNLGWMMGPWLVFAALLNGATIALFQGSPLGRDFGVFIQSAGVSMLGLVPSIAKAWRASDCMKGLNWDRLRCYSSTGEASSPEDYHWLVALAGYKPVIEYCGGTEIGGGFLGGTLVQPQAPSHFSTPTIGCRLALLDDQEVLYDSLQETGGGQQLESRGNGKAVSGELALVPPLLGSSQRLLNKSHYEVYYEGMPGVGGVQGPLRRHGDEVERLPGGFFVAHGRCDDTMNLGGIKVSSVELERVVIASVPAVMEAAAVGLTPLGGGPEQLIMFLVLHQHAEVVKSSPPQAPLSSSVNGQQRSQTQENLQSTLKQRGNKVGTSSSLENIWEAFYQVKDVAASAASRVTVMVVAAAQGDAGSSAGQQQTGPDTQTQQPSQHQPAAGGTQADLHELKLKCQQAIRSSLNPLFKLERVLLRDSLPRTASNKVMRRLLRDELRQTVAKM